MSATLHLPDEHARTDLATFLGRAARIEGGAIRLQSSGSVTAVWVPILRPQSIIDTSPIVLGMRAIAARIEGAEARDRRAGAVDVVVPIRGMLDRLASEREQHRLAIPLPPERLVEAWTGVTPPRAGWERVATVSCSALEDVAEAGIAEVARAVPGNLGTLIVERARTHVWESALDVPGAQGTGLVAGVAFAAHALGFLAGPDGEATIAQSGPWRRVSTPAGHVLTRARPSEN